MATKNYNIRFRNGKADEDRAWEHLHSEEVRHPCIFEGDGFPRKRPFMTKNGPFVRRGLYN